MRHSASRNRALTLIELIVALALSVLLMAVAIAIMRRAHDLDLQIDKIASSLSDRTLLRRQLQSDFVQSESMLIADNAVILHGHLHCDPLRQVMTQRPAIVRYVVNKSNGAAWLFREQWEWDATSDRPSNFIRQPIWYGVDRFQIDTDWIDVVESTELDFDLLDTPTIKESMGGMPVTISLSMWDKDNKLIHRQTIRHHEENEG